MQQILELDVGNTRIKWRLLASSTTGNLTPQADGVTIESLFQQCLTDVSQCRVSAVARYDEHTLLAKLPTNVDYLKAKTLAHYHALSNSYSEVNRMGVDRWLAMMAVWSKRPGPTLLVDAGTALKIEIIQMDGQHLGGYILPGFEMQRRALLQGTAHIQYQAPESDPKGLLQQAALMPGRSTETCIDQGIRLSQAAMIEKVMAQYPGYCLWLTGGDGVNLAQLLTVPCVYDADLVLDGLSLYADFLSKNTQS
jgi:type III pantothenate kinase